jgi:hypothetical protein
LTRALLAVAFAASACNQREPAQRHPGAVAAAQRCAHVFDTLDDIEPEERQRAIANACADVVVEKPCHDEFLAYETPPAQRIEKLVDTCAHAYCPILPDPKPARCTDPSGDVAAFWHAVHLFDLGPEATAILDAARSPSPPAPAPQPRLPRPDDVTWRIPIITVTKDAITLAWRPPQGADQVALAAPVASFDCAELREQLALEVMHTWPNTVRPTRSKQLLLSADAAAPYDTVLKVMDCANDRSGPRQLYPDVALSVQR